MVTPIAPASMYRTREGLGLWEHKGKVAAVGVGHSKTARRWDGTAENCIGAWAIEADAKYQSQQYFSVNNDPILSQGAYTIANAHVSWTSPGEHATVTAWVRNLADEDYLVAAFDLASFGWDQWVVGEPRTYGVTVEYHTH